MNRSSGGVRQGRGRHGRRLVFSVAVVLICLGLVFVGGGLSATVEAAISDGASVQLSSHADASTMDRLLNGEYTSPESQLSTGDESFSTVGVGAHDALLLVSAFSKLNDEGALEHELRAEINGIVASFPGLYLAQLVKRTNRNESTVRYHTRILERENELETATIWGNNRLYPAETRKEAFPYYAAIREPASARVFETIWRHEPVAAGEIAKLIGRSPSTVSHHLARFEDEELITRDRDGQSVKISLTELARRMATEDCPVPPES